VCVIVVVGLGLLSGSYHVLLHIGAMLFSEEEEEEEEREF
jgi:hypothetical protein